MKHAAVLLLAAAAAVTLSDGLKIDQFPATPGRCDKGSRDTRRRCIVHYVLFDNLSPSYVREFVTAFYTPDATYNSPSEVTKGRDAIIANFIGQGQGSAVRFTNLRTLLCGRDHCIVTYKFGFDVVVPINGTPTPIGYKVVLEAATDLHFNTDDKITYHRDYYDQLTFFGQVPNITSTVTTAFSNYIGQLIAQKTG